MRDQSKRFRSRVWGRFSSAVAAVVAGMAATAGIADAQETINLNHWGAVTAPVFGTSESGVYSSAELFAGPNKFGSNYFWGVLPNGRIVKPAGVSAQIGMNPLGVALTQDGRFLLTSNDDERDGGLVSLQNPTNKGGYSLSVIDTSTMKVVSQTNTAGQFFIGLQITGPAGGPYTAWVSGGPSNSIKLFTISSAGAISAAPTSSIVIAPILPNNQGYVSNYTPDAALNTADAGGNKPPVPSGFSRTGSTKITFPAGSALSPDGKYLYVACNGDNSLAIIDTSTQKVVKQVAVGRFPYSVTVSSDGGTVAVSNWGIMEYKFFNAVYDAATGVLKSLGVTGPNLPAGFFVPPQDSVKSSSAMLFSVPNGDPTQITPINTVSLGRDLDAEDRVGDTHPSALTIVGGHEPRLYVTKTNDDSLAILPLGKGGDNGIFDLSPVRLNGDLNVLVSDKKGHGNDNDHGRAKLKGSYPNAIVTSLDGSQTYVAEAGINSVAVLDTHEADEPKLLGRIPTGWYPTGLTLSADGKTLYVINAKGIGEDINPKTQNGPHNPTGVESFTDGNYIFGTVQKIDLTTQAVDDTPLHYNYAVQQGNVDTGVVPDGKQPSKKIKHVIFILHENKTFDSMLGNLSQFAPFAGMTFNDSTGAVNTQQQFTGVVPNIQLLASHFATAVNYYSDSEESDAGHQFAASGTASDYTEKTLLVKGGRGLLVNKNFEPEDYPAGGYIFNNAARHGVSFKDYGALVRIEGTDTGTSTTPGSTGTSGRASINDPASGNAGKPVVTGSGNSTFISNPLQNVGDVTSPTQGLGQSYFLQMPILAILGTNNPSGEPRLDKNYPGYNFNISDQRRAQEFIKDFDRMVASDTLPQFIYLYQPNDHTGGAQALNIPAPTAAEQVADGDVGLGMVIDHIMKSPIYYDQASDTGAAIFITFDDAQSTLDHIHEHRTPLVVVSPFAKPGAATRHYVTASVVKTEELLLGLPPNNLGDLFATDLRDMFQSSYNGVTESSLHFNQLATDYKPTDEGRKIWDLVKKLDTSAPDRDSRRLGMLARLSMGADQLHNAAAAGGLLKSEEYEEQQKKLYDTALAVAQSPAPKDNDD